MKKVLRNSIMLSAFLLMALMVNATVIGGGANCTTTGTIDPGSVAGCEDKTPKMKKLNCKTKEGGPAYGCSTSGDLEDCTVAQACP